MTYCNLIFLFQYSLRMLVLVEHTALRQPAWDTWWTDSLRCLQRQVTDLRVTQPITTNTIITRPNTMVICSTVNYNLNFNTRVSLQWLITIWLTDVYFFHWSLLLFFFLFILCINITIRIVFSFWIMIKLRFRH